jgi:hypothetical protein
MQHHGFQGGKPAAGSLVEEIQQEMKRSKEAGESPDFSDDEDYLHGTAVVKRHKDEERKRRREDTSCCCDNGIRAGCPIHGLRGNSRSFLEACDESEEDEEDSDGEAEYWSAVQPGPLREAPAATVASEASSSSSAPRVVPSASVVAGAPVPSGPSNVSELMGSAVREAFLSGIEQGKKMQLPTQCKTCAIRKERNRVAAKESRQKKRRDAEAAIFRDQVDRAAAYAASRSSAAKSASAGAVAGAGAGAGAGAEDEELVPPPF